MGINWSIFLLFHSRRENGFMWKSTKCRVYSYIESNDVLLGNLVVRGIMAVCHNGDHCICGDIIRRNCSAQRSLGWESKIEHMTATITRPSPVAPRRQRQFVSKANSVFNSHSTPGLIGQLAQSKYLTSKFSRMSFPNVTLLTVYG